MVVTAGNRRGVRFSQPGRPAGDRELLGGASRKDEHQMVAGSAVGLPLEVGITKAISENGIDSLVRLVGRRGLQLCAGRIRAANVASGWGTPRRSAGIQARAPTGSHDRPVRGIARTTNPPLIGLTHRSRYPTALQQRSTPRFALAPIGSRFGTEASITLPLRPGTAIDPAATAYEKCRLPGTFRVEPTGFEPVTSCLQSRRSPN